MRISAITGLFKPRDSEKIPLGALSYVKARGRQWAFDLITREFKKSGISQAMLASRLGTSPEVICRWLQRPGNWELDTFIILLFGISGVFPTFGTIDLIGRHAISSGAGARTNVVEFKFKPHTAAAFSAVSSSSTATITPTKPVFG